MIRSLNQVIRRSPATFIQDSIGASAIVVMLWVGLQIPAFY